MVRRIVLMPVDTSAGHVDTPQIGDLRSAVQLQHEVEGIGPRAEMKIALRVPSRRPDRRTSARCRHGEVAQECRLLSTSLAAQAGSQHLGTQIVLGAADPRFMPHANQRNPLRLDEQPI